MEQDTSHTLCLEMAHFLAVSCFWVKHSQILGELATQVDAAAKGQGKVDIGADWLAYGDE